MATEKLEIEIIAKGKPAEKAIKGVEKKTDQLGKTTKKTGKEIDRSVDGMKDSWAGLGAKIAAVTVVLGASVAKAKDFERASIGLTKAQKEWAQQASLSSDIGAEQVAGFLKSAQTAGLAEKEMKALAKQAIALGYAFPHEDAETLHDNLVMLSTTGEAQGFVVDILEQKMSSMGIALKDMDLKALSASEKLKLIGEVADKSQKQMDASKYRALNTAMGTMSNTLTNLGDKLVTMGSDSGAFAVITAAVKILADGIVYAFEKVGDLIQSFKDLDAWVTDDIFGLGDKNLRKFKAAGDKRNKEYLKQQKEAGEQQVKDRKELHKKIEKDEGSFLNRLLKKRKKARKGLGDIVIGSAKTLDPSKMTASGSHIMTDAVTEGERLTKIMANVTKATDESKTAFERMSKTGQSVVSGLADGFTNMVMGVKTSFKDMARAVIADLIRIRVQKALVGMFGGFFHTGTADVKHTGGAIGMAGIPSFHTGVRSDERIAKLQVGEAVINRGGAAKNRESIEAMNKGYSVGGQGGGVTTAEINFNVQAIDASSFNSYLVNNRGTIEGIINSSLTSNGSVRRTIRQVV